MLHTPYKTDRQIAGALELIFIQNKTLSKALQLILRQVNAQEQAELVQAVRRITRYRRLYREALLRTAALPREDAARETPDSSPLVAPARYVALYKLEQKPALACSSEEKLLLQTLDELKQVRALRESIADWLDELGEEAWGKAWDKTLAWQNTDAPLILRTNTLKTDRQALLAYLAERQIKGTAPAAYPEAVRLEQFADVFALPAFKQGWFEVQDAASQAVSRLLQPEPGMRVIDACAGHGGKTLHLAALMRNKGRIIALDTSGYKFEELTRRARRAGVSIVETRLIESTKTIKRLAAQADRLLLDVPCSGSGVWRRNPEGKWRFTQAELTRLLTSQWEILCRYSRLVKPGGRFVYAVCSLFPSEGEQQIARFLAQPAPGPQAGAVFKLLQEERLSPEQNGTDGFYMALLERPA